MGNTSSKSTYESYMGLIASSSSKQLLDCENLIDLSQAIVIEGKNNVVSGIKQVQGVELNMDCVQRAEFSDKMNVDLLNKLKQETSSKTGWGAIGNSKAEAHAKLETEIKLFVEKLVSTDCAFKQVANQTFSVTGEGNLVENVKQEQITKAMKKCTQDVIAGTDLEASLKAIADQKTTATMEGIPSLLIFLLLIIVAVAYGVYKQGTDLLKNKYFIAGVVALVTLLGGYYLFK